ncbi:MAG: hypothetical protein EOO17_02215 [Chloroflexi bacterium]|nr:MAG: hypothetical protein EOO17_02215 [Chloroflexota bacterium]
MLGKVLVTMSALATAVLFLVVNTTTPKSAGAMGVLGVFVLGYVIALGVISFMVYGLSKTVTTIINRVAVRRPVVSMTLKKSYYYASVIALAPVIIISLQSVGSVGVYEVALITLLVAIGCLYVAKRTA